MFVVNANGRRVAEVSEPLLGDSVDDPVFALPGVEYDTERGFSHSLARLRGRNVYWTYNDIVRSTTPEGVVREVGRGHAGVRAALALDRSHSTNGGLCSPSCDCELPDSSSTYGSPGVDATGQGRPVDGELNWTHSPIYPAASKLTDSVLRTLCERHEKYGPLNISASPGGALNGIRVRLFDKLARLNHALDTKSEAWDFEDDSFRDCFIDIIGYGVIGLMCLDGDWPA